MMRFQTGSKWAPELELRLTGLTPENMFGPKFVAHIGAEFGTELELDWHRFGVPSGDSNPDQIDSKMPCESHGISQVSRVTNRKCLFTNRTK